MRRVLTASLSVVAVAFAGAPARAEVVSPIIVNGINAMPQGDTEGRGIMNEAVMAALKRAGLTGTMRFRPWKRAQEETIHGKDILITALSRTPERESKFTWLFPVFNNERTFVTVGPTYTGFEAAKSALEQVAVTAGTAQLDILLARGFARSQIRVIQIENQIVIPTMLLENRADAWFVAVSEARYFLRGLPDAAKFVIGPPVGEPTEQYVACSKNCDPDLVARMRVAGEAMRADGTFDEILHRYQ